MWLSYLHAGLVQGGAVWPSSEKACENAQNIGTLTGLSGRLTQPGARLLPQDESTRIDEAVHKIGSSA